MWDENKIKLHREAAQRLDEVMAAAFRFIEANAANITERDVQQFILSEFKKRGLRSDGLPPIVAFGKNTSFVHYFPNRETNLKLQENMPIMIDIWARLDRKGAPFADITWYGYHGNNIPDEAKAAFDLVKLARDNTIDLIKKNLKKKTMPIGKHTDDAVRATFAKDNFQIYFLHGTGHSLGFYSAHGRLGGLRQKTKSELKQNIAYTIEPGLYFENRFGVRLEMNFYIDDNFKFLPTTKIQKEIVII